ncbi:MAG: amidase [Pseudomonadota bacterium]|nr:amidase [Pseudomonadota bacterium]
MSELHHLTIAQGSALIAQRAISPSEWARALLDPIAAHDGNLNAFLHVTFERAIAVACDAEREIAAGRWRGPLHGVPFALKDVFDTAGIPTTAQSRIAIDRVPTADATVTARLHQAGALLIGKLALHEFAHGGPSLDIPWPNARNPWNPLHFAGSSGSGSAVAVAAGFVPAAMGTDTGGSIRIPAGLCGIAGLKPTFGLVSRRGVIRARRASIIAARWHGPRRTARFCCRRLPAMTPQILRVATSAFQITRRS